ncbi:MAG: heme exporter protein CcmB [Chloroflexi bacterium]|nr:heme exporter protein CcmB [Chloroflexota bacterium]MBK6710415.1 heme exporter protein CcmB [Chloroflexota bacterium]MBK7180638.1 heme exporter protein CcmB [Chloroflexota bacterium]MBK7917662.1 heme exporter protein CcmB [Chloroflexota bacterium]MBK8934653.1 heme exporter protein CcmB [Chloroflexota bacterium]
MSEHTPLTRASESESKVFLTAVWAIVWKDLRIEQHTRQTISVMVMFSVVTVIMFNFALEANLDAARNVATGLLWATILLAGTLGLNRSLAIERENQTIDALLMAPIPRNAIYLGKVISVTLFTLALEVVLILLFIVFFDKPLWRPVVLLVLVLGTIGYVAAGVIVTSMTIQTRSREVLLPVLLLPLSLPLVLPSATAVALYMFPQQPVWGEVQSAVSIIIIYDLLMLTAGFLTYHFVVES